MDSGAPIALFVIAVLAAIVIGSMNVLAASYPEVALCICVFCFALLSVLVIMLVASKRNSEE